MKSSLALLSALLLTVATSADSPVADAAMNGDTESVRALLRGGADVNAAQGDGMTALHWAAVHDEAEMADLILYAGANLEAATRLGGFTPLLVGSRAGSAAAVRYRRCRRYWGARPRVSWRPSDRTSANFGRATGWPIRCRPARMPANETSGPTRS